MGCFRHRVLLSRQLGSPMVHYDQDRGAGEYGLELLPCQQDDRRAEDLPERQSPLRQPRLHGGRADLSSEFQRPVRPDEVVMAAQQLEVSFQSLPPSRVARRSASQIRSALSYRQIQPFDEGRVVSFSESSQSRYACSHRQAAPILVLRSTLTTRSFRRVLITRPYRRTGPKTRRTAFS